MKPAKNIEKLISELHVGTSAELDEKVQGAIGRAAAEAGNRQRIHTALSRKGRRWRVSWWRRRMAVPFPMAAGFVAVFGILVWLQASQIDWGPESAQERGPIQRVMDIGSDTGASETGQGRYHPYESAVYVAGMGFVERNYGRVFIRENNHENN